MSGILPLVFSHLLRRRLPWLLGLSGLFAAYSLAAEPYWLEVTRPDVPVPDLPPDLGGATILLLADTHVGNWGRREPQILRHLKSLPTPDLIVWGGDFLQRQSGIVPSLRLVEGVTARYPGVPQLGILGNAEHKLQRKDRVAFVGALEACGVTMLINRHITLRVRGVPITVAGVDDPFYGHADLKTALASGPPRENFVLLLSHSPQLAVGAAGAGVAVMLSGHTHGGQVRLPLIGPLKTQNPLHKRMDFGIWNRQRLFALLGYDPGGPTVTYISRGIGAAPLPKIRQLGPRFLCRPEIALLTLRREEKERGEGRG